MSTQNEFTRMSDAQLAKFIAKEHARYTRLEAKAADRRTGGDELIRKMNAAEQVITAAINELDARL